MRSALLEESTWHYVNPDRGHVAQTRGSGKASRESARWRALGGTFLTKEMVSRNLVSREGCRMRERLREKNLGGGIWVGPAWV